MEHNENIEIIVCSSELNLGYDLVKEGIKDGVTAAFIGSSGVGKSTLINHVIGEEILKTSGIRQQDGRGRHTTTHRQLIQLVNGGCVIDTPGMRELQLDESDVDNTFEDIEELASRCRFGNCTHGAEPSCAVRAAIEDGRLPIKRFKNYVKLKKEEAARQIRKSVGTKRRR